MPFQLQNLGHPSKENPLIASTNQLKCTTLHASFIGFVVDFELNSLLIPIVKEAS